MNEGEAEVLVPRQILVTTRHLTPQSGWLGDGWVGWIHFEVDYAEEYLRNGGTEESLGIISPYDSQALGIGGVEGWGRLVQESCF